MVSTLGPAVLAMFLVPGRRSGKFLSVSASDVIPHRPIRACTMQLGEAKDTDASQNADRTSNCSQRKHAIRILGAF